MHPRDMPVHFTNLREMSKSPLHYLTRIQSPSEPTPAMRLGTLVHSLIDGVVPLIYEGSRRGNAWQAFQKANEGEDIFTRAEADRAKRCVDKLWASRVAAPLLKGKREETIAWSLGSRACSSRLDVLGDGFITELKTASSVQPDRFRSACVGRFAYHAQLAFYRMAAAWQTRADTLADSGVELRDVPRCECFIVGVESVAPHDVVVFRLTERCLDAGARLCHSWLTRLASCEESDEWPGYSQCVIDLDDDAADDLIFDDPNSPEPGDEEAA